MKCPKCKYVSFEYLDVCRKCGRDLIKHKGEYHIFAPIVIPIDIGSYQKKLKEEKISAENVEEIKEHHPSEETAGAAPMEEIDIAGSEDDIDVSELPEDTIRIEGAADNDLENNEIDLISIDENLTELNNESIVKEESANKKERGIKEDEKSISIPDELVQEGSNSTAEITLEDNTLEIESVLPVGEITISEDSLHTENPVPKKEDEKLEEGDFDFDAIDLEDPLELSSDSDLNDNTTSEDKKETGNPSDDIETLDINEIDLE